MTTTERKPRHKFPKSENPRDLFLRVRVTKAELNFVDRCIAHGAMGRGDEDTRSAFVRWLVTEYAAAHGIPFDPTKPDPMNAGQMFSTPGPVDHHRLDASSLEGNIDPDRFDERNTSVLEPLPETKEE